MSTELTYFRAQPTDPGAFQGPPRACPMCLVGACHACTGRLRVLNAAGLGRDEPCEHRHLRPKAAAVDPGPRTLADIPIRSRS